jgi:hypothetical protein
MAILLLLLSVHKPQRLSGTSTFQHIKGGFRWQTNTCLFQCSRLLITALCLMDSFTRSKLSEATVPAYRSMGGARPHSRYHICSLDMRCRLDKLPRLARPTTPGHLIAYHHYLKYWSISRPGKRGFIVQWKVYHRDQRSEETVHSPTRALRAGTSTASQIQQ